MLNFVVVICEGQSSDSLVAASVFSSVLTDDMWVYLVHLRMIAVTVVTNGVRDVVLV